MSIRSRIKRIETIVKPEEDPAGTYGLTLDQWQKLARGEDPEIPQKQQAAFAGWMVRANERLAEAAATMALYKDEENQEVGNI